MEDIENIRMLRMLKHSEKHPEVDLINLIERKEIDINTNLWRRIYPFEKKNS